MITIRPHISSIFEKTEVLFLKWLMAFRIPEDGRGAKDRGVQVASMGRGSEKGLRVESRVESQGLETE
jgi:hypothetical protein